MLFYIKYMSCTGVSIFAKCILLGFDPNLIETSSKMQKFSAGFCRKLFAFVFKQHPHEIHMTTKFSAVNFIFYCRLLVFIIIIVVLI